MARARKSTHKGQSGHKAVSGATSLAALDIGRDQRASDFIQQVQPVRTRNDVILSPTNVTALTRLVEEFRAGDTLRRHGVDLRSRILFCGPPGCGKTLTAEVFARELGLDLFVVRLDAIISSFLGETASNLRAVIEAAGRQPCVLFFDEFDALARTRADSRESGEIRRVVNSLLLLIEGYRGRGYLIAATNLEQSLDPAIWRRFDDVISFERPTSAKIVQMLRLKTRNFPASFKIETRAKNLEGFSYAEIDRVCAAATRSAILAKRKRISAADFDLALKNERRRRKIEHRLGAAHGQS